MEPFTWIVIIAVFFMLFLMLTSGRRRHRLEEALNKLETERMRLMKSIEHIKLSFYQRKLDEKDAQDKIFKYEEELRDIEGKISEIQEKPLMRTLKKQEVAKLEKDADAKDVVIEKAEVAKSERVMLHNMGAKAFSLLLVIIIIAFILAMFVFGRTSSAQTEDDGSIDYSTIKLPVSARTSPTSGTYPGGAATLWVDISNPTEDSLKDLVLIARLPVGSGLRFNGGSIEVINIPELEAGGERQISIPVSVNRTTADGEYVLRAEVQITDVIVGEASAKLTVKIGKGEEDLPRI